MLQGLISISLTALRDCFCDPQSEKLHALIQENLKFGFKTDTLENFLNYFAN